MSTKTRNWYSFFASDLLFISRQSLDLCTLSHLHSGWSNHYPPGRGTGGGIYPLWILLWGETDKDVSRNENCCCLLCSKKTFQLLNYWMGWIIAQCGFRCLCQQLNAAWFLSSTCLHHAGSPFVNEAREESVQTVRNTLGCILWHK